MAEVSQAGRGGGITGPAPRSRMAQRIATSCGGRTVPGPLAQRTALASWTSRGDSAARRSGPRARDEDVGDIGAANRAERRVKFLRQCGRHRFEAPSVEAGGIGDYRPSRRRTA